MPPENPTLADLGIDKKTSARAQQTSKEPAMKFIGRTSAEKLARMGPSAAETDREVLENSLAIAASTRDLALRSLARPGAVLLAYVQNADPGAATGVLQAARAAPVHAALLRRIANDVEAGGRRLRIAFDARPDAAEIEAQAAARRGATTG